MAATVYAQRCDELKSRFLNNSKTKEPNFITQWNALWGLSNTGRLSRHNVIWLGKQINVMSDAWHEPDQLEMIQQLRERQERAWRRWEKRIAEYAVARASGTRGKKKEPKPTSTPDPSAIDPWSLLK
jgi:hypothetical protein